MKELIEIQSRLKAPKGQYNNFGKYKYRNCEDILEAVKPLLYEFKCQLSLIDEIQMIGNRFYVKATARIKSESGEEEIVTAFAREEESKKGMDGSQVTGASSSYARKYALNGLFCIDDNKDSDYTNKGDKQSSEVDEFLEIAIQDVNMAQTMQSLQDVWKQYTVYHSDKEFIKSVNNRKAELK